MRLNRVLQTTAAAGIAIAATIFTISCGEDGSNGADGASCTISTTATGYDVLCGGTKVGQLASGGVGDPGVAGPAGSTGNNGVGCVIGDKVGDAYQIKCGDQVRGTLNGCKVESDTEENTLTIDCGSATLAMCGINGATPPQTIFDPEIEECNASTGIPASRTLKCTLDTNVTYNAKTQYCGFANSGALDAGTPTALSLCGKDGKPNDETQTEWKNEYCRIIREIDPEKGPSKATYSFKVEAPTDCDGTGIKLDEATTYPTTAASAATDFAGNYCGYTDENATVRSIQTGICDDGKGPDEDAWEAGYCQVATPDSKVANFSTVFCNPAGFNQRGTTKRFNEGSWKNQYCGYVDAAAAAEGGAGLSVITAQIGGYNGNSTCTGTPTNTNCGLTVGMFSSKEVENIAIAKRLSAECAVKQINGEFNTTAPYPTTASSYDGTATHLWTINDNVRLYEFCSVNVDDKGDFFIEASSRQIAIDNGGCPGPDSPTPVLGPTTELNKETWSKQYCAYTSSNANAQINTTPTTIPSTCGFLKPNLSQASTAAEMQYCQADSTGALSLKTPQESGCDAPAKINDGSWKNEYCGYNSTSASAKKVVVKAVNARCALLAPNSVNKPTAPEEMEYCTVNKEGEMTLTTPGANDCTANNAKLNEGSWTGEYCGYANATATNKTVIKTFTDAKGGIACNLLTPNKEQPSDPMSLEYCQADREGKLSLVKVSDDDCNTKAADRINEGVWAGWYCVGVNRVQCQGGLVANPDYDGSTGKDAPPKCIWPQAAAKRSLL